jgi:hypothetical protein
VTAWGGVEGWQRFVLGFSVPTKAKGHYVSNGVLFEKQNKVILIIMQVRVGAAVCTLEGPPRHRWNRDEKSNENLFAKKYIYIYIWGDVDHGA